VCCIDVFICEPGIREQTLFVTVHYRLQLQGWLSLRKLAICGDFGPSSALMGDKTTSLGLMGDKTTSLSLMGDKTTSLGLMGDKTSSGKKFGKTHHHGLVMEWANYGQACPVMALGVEEEE